MRSFRLPVAMAFLLLAPFSAALPPADEDPWKGETFLSVIVLLAFSISALAIGFVRKFQSFDSMVAVTGFIVGVILILLRAKASGLAPFYVLGAVSLLLGLALSVSGLSSGCSLGLYYALMGTCFLVSGGLTLWHYLHENPPSAEQ